MILFDPLLDLLLLGIRKRGVSVLASAAAEACEFVLVPSTKPIVKCHPSCLKDLPQLDGGVSIGRKLDTVCPNSHAVKATVFMESGQNPLLVNGEWINKSHRYLSGSFPIRWFWKQMFYY